jgi:putative acetyltransferase
VIIRAARGRDTAALLAVERAAFGRHEEAGLVRALLGDPSAAPCINLVAEADGAIIGHVLLSHATVATGGTGHSATILAPLAVAPAAQGRGVGQALCREGISAARELGIGLVFVLGHIGYYPRFGFRPAGAIGLEAPYPIDPAVADAWMVLETRPGLIGSVRGTVRAADTLMRPDLWAE